MNSKQMHFYLQKRLMCALGKNYLLKNNHFYGILYWKCFSCFRTICTCECTFYNVKHIKSKERNRLTDKTSTSCFYFWYRSCFTALSSTRRRTLPKSHAPKKFFYYHYKINNNILMLLFFFLLLTTFHCQYNIYNCTTSAPPSLSLWRISGSVSDR